MPVFRIAVTVGIAALVSVPVFVINDIMGQIDVRRRILTDFRSVQKHLIVRQNDHADRIGFLRRFRLFLLRIVRFF